MDPLLLQKQLRNNADDLQDFYKDLKTWGDEMKKRDAALKNTQSPDNKQVKAVECGLKKKKEDKPKATKSRKLEEKVKKPQSHCTDYSAWEKFDVEEECNKLDSESSEGSLTDEHEDTKRDEAVAHKERGNNLVKKQKWKEAIDCYTKAINCYRYDAVFFANRALCYLKMKEYKKAEEDCTLSLKLDPSYVKAYQRRSAARENLNELNWARFDLEKVLEYEPNNKESITSLQRVEAEINKKKSDPNRPVSKFAASRGQKSLIKATTKDPPKEEIIDTAQNLSNWPGGDDVVPVKAIKKPPHMQSKKPLKRIKILEADSSHTASPGETPAIPVAIKSKILERIPASDSDPPRIDVAYPKPGSRETVIRTDDIEVVDRIMDEFSDFVTKKDLKNSDNIKKVQAAPAKDNKSDSDERFEVPKTSVQFYTCWKNVTNGSRKFDYLKLIASEGTFRIFNESLDSDVFSEILTVLVDHFIPRNEPLFEILDQLTEIRRFSTLVMFMGADEKNCVWKLIDHVKTQEGVSKEEVDGLIAKFEL